MNEEIIKGKSESYSSILFIVLILIIIGIASIFNAKNILIPLSIIPLFFGIIYFLIRNFNTYIFYPDRIEIHYSFRKNKNKVILKSEIKYARYEEIEGDPKLIIFYKKNNLKVKSIIRMQHSFSYIYDSSIYKILSRMKNWNVKMELETGRNEILLLFKE